MQVMQHNFRMDVFCEGLQHPIIRLGEEDINIYNVSCQKELSQLQSIIVLESTDTKKQINQLINSSNAIGIANSGSETFMIPVSIISPGTIVLSNKKKSILLKATV